MPKEQEETGGTELVQCPNCLGYFQRQLEHADELPDDAIERHVCLIGSRRVESSS